MPRSKKTSRSLHVCAFCRGRGVDPFGVPSKISQCQVCQGRGKNFILEPSEACVACRGTGVYKHHRLSCALCKGRGFLHHIPGKDRTYGCKPENDEMLDRGTGLPCIQAYDLTSMKKGRIQLVNNAGKIYRASRRRPVTGAKR